MTHGNTNHPTPDRPVSVAIVPRQARRRPGPRVRPQLLSREAQRVAAAILEVLAGVRTPTDAAAALGMGVPRYYVWEQRALAALVAGCEPRPAGRTLSQRHQIAVLEKEVARLKQDCARQQALVRAAQRTIGLAPAAAKPVPKAGERAAGKPAGKKPRKRRPAVRALKAATTLRAMPVADELAAIRAPGAPLAEVVQRSAADRPPPAAVPAEAAPAAAGT